MPRSDVAIDVLDSEPEASRCHRTAARAADRGSLWRVHDNALLRAKVSKISPSGRHPITKSHPDRFDAAAVHRSSRRTDATYITSSTNARIGDGHRGQALDRSGDWTP